MIFGYFGRVLTRARGWVVVVVILLLFFALGLMAFESIRSAIYNAEIRRQSYDAVLSLDQAVRVVAEAQNAQRGYVITGQEVYLGEYSGAERDAQTQLETLAQRDAFAPPALTRLQGLITALFDEMDNTVEVRRTSAERAIAQVQDQRGKRFMDSIKEETNVLRSRERDRINLLTLQTQRNADTTMKLLPLAGGIGFIVILVTIWVIYTADRQKDQAWKEKMSAWEAQHRAEQSLDQSRQQFQRVVDNVHDYGIVLIDPKGTVRTWNAGAQQITGYGPDEAIGRSLSEFYYSPEQVEAGMFVRALETARTTGQFHDEDWRVKKDGTRIWASISMLAIKDESGEVANYLKITRDLSVKRQSELELQRAEAFFRTTIDLAPNAVVIGDPQGIIKVWNTQAETTFGYTQDEAIGKAITMLMPERYREEHRRGLERATITGNTPLARHPLELMGLRKNGREFPLELTFDALRQDGDVNYVAILRDVSERRQAEHALRGLNQQLKLLNAELVRSNSELDQFAAVASHDLKSPLRQVVSYVQLLDRRYSSLLDDDGKQFVRYAVEGATRMQALINDLLTFSRAGSGEFIPKAVDMGRVVELALRNLNGWLAENHAEIHRPDDLPQVWGDEGSLIQVFQNLISNGIKFSSPSTRPEIWITVTPHGQGWQFVVRDNGIGMEPEHLDQIWVMFKRLNGTDYPGTGIGLSIVKKVVERHGGDIGVESKPGQGSTFFVTLPAVPK